MPRLSPRSINMSRDANVYNILSEDVEMRKQRDKERKYSKKKEIKKWQQKVIKPNDKSNAMMARRFKKEFRRVLRTITGQETFDENLTI